MRTIILLLTIAIVTSCNNNDDIKDDFQPIEITPILISKQEVFNLNYSPPTKVNLVFDNENDWQDFVENDWKIANPPAEANVDFNIHKVIACIDAPRTAGGFDLTITSILEYKSNIVVKVKYVGEGGFTDKPTRPHHFVKIPKSNKPIIFESNNP